MATAVLPRAGAHPLNERVNQILNDIDFDYFVDDLCRRFYAAKVGGPSRAPAINFRLPMIGRFEGIDSERGIAWRLADSLALRHIAGFALNEGTPDHSTIRRNRRLIDLETHPEVFTWMLQVGECDRYREHSFDEKLREEVGAADPDSILVRHRSPSCGGSGSEIWVGGLLEYRVFQDQIGNDTLRAAVLAFNIFQTPRPVHLQRTIFCVRSIMGWICCVILFADLGDGPAFLPGPRPPHETRE